MKKRILLVDDEEILGEMVKHQLEKTGKYEVRVESRSVQALETALQFRPDLIFLDIQMPELDGSSVCQQLESDGHFKNVPIVFLTGMVKEEEAERDFIGGRPFIAKPYTVRSLIEYIEKTLA